MNTISAPEAIKCMNRMGKLSEPFLFMVDFTASHAVVIPLQDIDSKEMAFSVGNYRSGEDFLLPLPEQIQFETQPISFARYERAFEQVQAEIYQGNSYLLNLTFPTRIQTNLELKTIYANSTAPYRLWWKDKMVVFSPESFIQIRDGLMYSYPMKGTIRADLPGAAQRLLTDQKEKAEHATIVDLIRNDIGRIASLVNVQRFRYLDKIITNQGLLYQTSSEISGRLDQDYPERIGDLLFSLLPAGSISGAPKKKTLSIIQEAENYERGFYTGVFGVFDGRNLDSGVMIRFIEHTPDGLVFKSGGGITHLSTVEEEYSELIDKVYLPFVTSEAAASKY